MAQMTVDLNVREVTLYFHGRLAGYLARDKQSKRHAYSLNGPTAVKHAIEVFGVPHTEVDCILVDGLPVGFSHILQEGDRLDVYPSLPPKVVSPPSLRPVLPFPPRFVADNHLGRLVTGLRLLGVDVLHPKHLDDAELAELAVGQGRVLLSRDRRLLMRKIVVHGYCLQTRDPRQQLFDVLDRFNLHQAILPWTRCLRCNGQLRRVAKEEIIQFLEPKTKKYYREFHMCQECRQIYWKGSHYHPLLDFVDGVLGDLSSISTLD
jgi:hypothetical protein